MSANSTNASHPPPTSPFHHLYQPSCFDSTVGQVIVSFVISTSIFILLPLSLFVLYLGVQRWRRQRSAASTAQTTSHSDFFTYNMAVMELLGVAAYVFFFCGRLTELPAMRLVETFLGILSWCGQMIFPILTCVEHYLAVVHPITYRGLRQGGGVRIRNITTGCVWLLCLGGSCFLLLYIIHHHHGLLPAATMSILSLVVMTFCSLSVLRVLIRPWPGKEGGAGVQVDQSKQRAVHTILIIMGVLWLKLGWNVVAVVMTVSESASVRCFADVSNCACSLPSSLVLPVLFLQRAGKLPGCKRNTGSE